MNAAASRSPREITVLTLVAAAAWVSVVLVVRGSGMAMSSTMGLPLLGFVGAWALMMAAMMLPAVAPVASLYVGAMGARSGARLAQFALGYLALWTLLGLPAFAAARVIDVAAMDAAAAVRWGLVAILVAVAAYQLTPLKRLCLDHCRSPLSHLLHYAGYRGPLRDLRVGLHHGLYCSGCCWPLMLLLLAVGTMNLTAMLALTVVVLTEKLLPRGEVITRAIAVAALCGAVLLAVFPALFDAMAMA